MLVVDVDDDVGVEKSVPEQRKVQQQYVARAPVGTAKRKNL